MVALKTFLVAFTALTASASAAAIRPPITREMDLDSLITAPICPVSDQVISTSNHLEEQQLIKNMPIQKGQSFWSVTNQATVPKHTAADVWSYLGNFCSVAWQGFALIGTTGTCNYPLSTRTFSTLGLALTEKLLLNYGNSVAPNQKEQLFFQAFELLGNPQLAGTSVTQVHDLLKVTNSDAGAQIIWIVQGEHTAFEIRPVAD